jgi:hypothetical protein
MPDILLATACENTAEILAGRGEPGEYTKAVEWFRHAPGGGVVRLTWGVTAVESWRHRKDVLLRQARMLMAAAAVSRVGVAAMTVTT